MRVFVLLIIGAARARVHFTCDDAIAGEDVRGARHAGIEAADRAQDVDAFEICRVGEGLEQRRVQDGFFVRAGIVPRITR